MSRDTKRCDFATLLKMKHEVLSIISQIGNMQDLALVSFLQAEHVKTLRELNYRIISNIVHVIITRIKI